MFKTDEDVHRPFVLYWFLEDEKDEVVVKTQIAIAARALFVRGVDLELRVRNQTPATGKYADHQAMLLVLHDEKHEVSRSSLVKLKRAQLPSFLPQKVAMVSADDDGIRYMAKEVENLALENLGMKMVEPRPLEMEWIRYLVGNTTVRPEENMTSRCQKTGAKKCFCPALKETMRRLWTDHVVWTRLAIIDIMDNKKGKTATMNRLMKNQEHIGSAIANFYGPETGAQLTSLLKAHILAVADYLDIALAYEVSGPFAVKGLFEQDPLQVRMQAMFTNADKIAAFLHKANPKFTTQEGLKDLLYAHLNVTHKEIKLRLDRKWEADVTQFDVVMDQIMVLSDTLTIAISNQFPDKVRKGKGD